MILVIDNYDSFTFNLVQSLRELGAELRVERNDSVDVERIAALTPDAIVLSPGPGEPGEAGVSTAVVSRLSAIVPILGVCLGHQCIAAAFGAKVVRAKRLMHGKTSLIEHDGRTIFAGVARPFEAMRYHSLIVDADSLPACFEVSAWSEEGELMAIRHRHRPLEGVQFHPESFMTAEGKVLLQNFLRLYAHGYSTDLARAARA